jgi:hypothetical protein
VITRAYVFFFFFFFLSKYKERTRSTYEKLKSIRIFPYGTSSHLEGQPLLREERGGNASHNQRGSGLFSKVMYIRIDHF